MDSRERKENSNISFQVFPRTYVPSIKVLTQLAVVRSDDIFGRGLFAWIWVLSLTGRADEFGCPESWKIRVYKITFESGLPTVLYALSSLAIWF